MHAGRTPRDTGDGLTVADLCNKFLNRKKSLIDTGEITQRTFYDYHWTCGLIVKEFGRSRLVDDLATDDFEGFRVSLAKTRGPVALGNLIQRVKSVFKHATVNNLIDKPISYGNSFEKPSKKVIRKARNGNGQRMFEAEELRLILDAASQPFRVIILLAINAGYGQTDISSLPISAIDFDENWVDFPRPKSGIFRRCKLWPETAASLKGAIEKRPRPKNKADDTLVFLTKHGNPWTRESRGAKKTWIDSTGVEFSKLLKSVGLKRDRLNFYALRHTFQTIAEECRDFPAIMCVMGHIDSGMSAVYRERISDQRLQAVTDTVREWLWPDTTNEDADN